MKGQTTLCSDRLNGVPPVENQVGVVLLFDLLHLRVMLPEESLGAIDLREGRSDGGGHRDAVRVDACDKSEDKWEDIRSPRVL